MNSGRAILLAGSACLAGCSTLMPDIPPDPALPLQKIVEHTVCELRSGFRSVKASYPSAGADKWIIAISITPKVDTEVTASAGVTRKDSLITTAFFRSWTLGTAPGAQFDMKGHRDSAVNFNVKSAQLLSASSETLNCAISDFNDSVLAQHLGVDSWLNRIFATAQSSLSNLVQLDKPTFSSEIVIAFNGSGSFTFNFPIGTDFASLYGKYSSDEILSITMTKDTSQKIIVQTLPSGGVFAKNSVPITSISVISPEQRLDTLQLEQAIKNIRLSPTQSSQ
jgi:hypothetical protein